MIRVDDDDLILNVENVENQQSTVSVFDFETITCRHIGRELRAVHFEDALFVALAVGLSLRQRQPDDVSNQPAIESSLDLGEKPPHPVDAPQYVGLGRSFTFGIEDLVAKSDEGLRSNLKPGHDTLCSARTFRSTSANTAVKAISISSAVGGF